MAPPTSPGAARPGLPDDGGRGALPSPVALPDPVPLPPSPEDLLVAVARGDEHAFAALFDRLGPRVLGLARRIVRDPMLAEDVAQEVFVELWRTATRFDPARGSATSWALMLTHRRSVDRVRSAQATADRDQLSAARSVEREVDVVAEEVATSLEAKAVRRCLDGLTELQRESITLAYYAGYTYREVAALLTAPLPTVKTRMRDGLIRLRDCLGVTS